MHLVIGGRGLVGTALVHHLISRNLPLIATTRHEDESLFKLDLSEPERWKRLPMADFVYLVAAIPKLAYCEEHPDLSWRVNVDAPISLAKNYSRWHAFVTFVSSNAVEVCGNTAYGRQKAAAEAYMHTIDAAIVRPSRVPPERATDLAGFLVQIALRRRIGVHHWVADV